MEYFFEIMTKVLKIFMYLVFFFIILGGIVLCKATVLILTHQYGKASDQYVVSKRFKLFKARLT